MDEINADITQYQKATMINAAIIQVTNLSQFISTPVYKAAET